MKTTEEADMVYTIETSEVMLTSEEVDHLLAAAPSITSAVKGSAGAIGARMCVSGAGSYAALQQIICDAGLESGKSCYLSTMDNGPRDVRNMFVEATCPIITS